MKVAFNVGNLSLRGTTTAIMDYAKYNQSLLNNESIISINKRILSENLDENFCKRNEIANYFRDNYDVIEYSSNEELKLELDKRNCDHIYFLKAGTRDNQFVEGKKNLIHAVFNYYDHHGYKYVYISDWLAQEASGGRCKAVPHIVDMPKEETTDFRKKLNISKDKLVIGRYGGYDQFDIEFVKQTIAFIVNFEPSIVFVFVNTRPFMKNKNVLFLDPIIDPQEKTNFIKSCDAMIHARSDGESFGLAVCEFLFHGKRVISFGGGRDQNHVELLKDYDLIYNNQYELFEKIFKLKYCGNDPQIYSNIVKPFSPENVMKKFDEVFLND